MRGLPADPAIGGEPERRGGERSETPRSGGSPPIARAIDPPDPEVRARRPRRRFRVAYKLEILRQADACTRPGEVGALLRKEGLYSSHLVTWRREREAGLTPKPRGRTARPVDARVKTLEHENRRLTRRLQKAEAVIEFQKKVSELLQIPLNPYAPDDTD